MSRLASHPFLQDLQLAFQRDPDLLLQAAQARGDSIHIQLGGRHLFLFNHAEAALEILALQHAHFIKGRAHRRARRWLGSGLLVCEGAQHREVRRLLQPPFQQSNVMAYVPIIVEHTARRSATWHADEIRDLWPEMLQLALTIVTQIISGIDLSDEAPALNHALATLSSWFGRQRSYLATLVDLLPLQARHERRHSQQVLDQSIERMLAPGMRRSATDPSIVAHLLRAGMPLELIRDQMLALLFAGRETVAVMLTWACYELARRSDLADALYAEIDTVLGGRLPQPEDLPQLRFTRMLLSETLRYYPPAWSTSRQALEACQIGGTSVPCGAAVQISQFVLHRDGRYFNDPHSFAPQRWSTQAPSDVPKGAFIPFGIGPRRCLGESLAWVEGMLVLATLARQWRMALVSPDPPALLATTSLQPRGGLPVRLIPRQR